MKAEEYRERHDKLEGWDVKIRSYRAGDTYHCHVDNVEPGATVSRGDGMTLEEAEKSALEKARARLSKTRRAGF